MADQPSQTLQLGGRVAADMLAGQRKLREAMIEVASAARATPILVQRIHELERVNAALAGALAAFAEAGETIDSQWDDDRRLGSIRYGDNLRVRHPRAAVRAMRLYRDTAPEGRR